MRALWLAVSTVAVLLFVPLTAVPLPAHAAPQAAGEPTPRPAPAPSDKPAVAPERGPADTQALPPDADGAKAALDATPRHTEWIDVKVAASGRAIRTFVAYPERKDKAGAVIVIHENSGLTDWVRGVADQLAADGFIALAPDLLSGKGPGGGNSDSIGSRDDAIQTLRGLADQETLDALEAVRRHALALPAANGKAATVGFCWGGARSFAFAAVQPQLDAAVVYYGAAPEAEKLGTLQAPVLGLYGGDDARVNATVEPAAAELKRLGKTYETEIYDGAGHGFLRAQSGRDGANRRATQQAWPRTLAFLRSQLAR